MLAAPDEAAQDVADRGEIGDLRLDRREALRGEGPGARVPGAVVQLQQDGDLVEGEPERLGALDEAQTVRIFEWIEPLSAVGPGRGPEESQALVVADRLDADAGRRASAPILTGCRFMPNPLTLCSSTDSRLARP